MSRSDKFEDISSQSTPEGFKEKVSYKKEKAKTFFLRNHKKNLKTFLCVVVCLVLVVCALLGVYLRKMLSLINYDDGILNNPDATFDMDEADENLSFQTMYDIESADSVKDLIKTWATNGGEQLYSKYVINVLLIGEDDDDGSHRSDSTILASVNTKTKKITLVSFLRDSYTYMDINGEDRFDKTNHSYSWGGPSKLMEVISNNYKIKVDHYVSINFQSFEKVVDLLGGVSVPITETEAKYMNRTTKIAGFTSGDNVLLNGKRALIYSRIRYLDSEIERTRRQRNVISSIAKNVKASNFSDLNKVIETFLPYITTNYKASEIVTLASQALREGWMNYTIEGIVEPSEELRYGVKAYRTYTGYLDVWIVDYIKAAREVQLSLYGKTNIEINSSTHVSAIDLVKGGDNGNYNGNTDSYYNVETTTRRSLFNWVRGKKNTESKTESSYNWSGDSTQSYSDETNAQYTLPSLFDEEEKETEEDVIYYSDDTGSEIV